MSYAPQIRTTLAERCLQLSAGGYIDCAAAERWDMDLQSLRRLAEAYKVGWLHNVMSRITPLTLRRQEDYLMMADLFVENAGAAQRLLEKFQADLELFCELAGIQVTEHMNMDSVSDELTAHIQLYKEIGKVLADKFGIDVLDPLEAITSAPLVDDADEFVRSYMLKKFPKMAA